MEPGVKMWVCTSDWDTLWIPGSSREPLGITQEHPGARNASSPLCPDSDAVNYSKELPWEEHEISLPPQWIPEAVGFVPIGCISLS